MWFDESTAGYVGVILGCSCGLMGAILGIFVGVCIPKGKRLGLVYRILKLFIIIGVLIFITGGTALLMGEPRHVWYPFLLCGFITTFVLLLNYPNIKRSCTVAELKKMHINDLD